jgi:hypothetical protein
MATYWYRAYGMTICSELRLPVPPTQAAPAADVMIRLGKVPVPADYNPRKTTLLRATPDDISCQWENVGSFSARHGREIIADPFPGADEAKVSGWLQGTVISLLLHQRGFLVMHSSSVAVGNTAVAFLGEVGWGKSTTAAALCARGHRLIADDVVAVRVGANASPSVIPGFATMKLLPEAIQFLGGDPEALPRVAGDEENKRLRVMDQGAGDAPVPLKYVYILGEAESCRIDRIAPQSALLELMRHAFVARMTDFLQSTNTATSHFAQCTKLVNDAAICRLLRPRSLALLPSLVQMVEQQVTGVSRAG